MIFDKIKIRPCGDDALAIVFGDAIDPGINQYIRKFLLALEENKPESFIEAIPSYTQITILYDPLLAYYEEMLDWSENIIDHLSTLEVPEPQTIRIPVLYGGEYGPDLGRVAAHNQLSEEEVIAIHSAEKYLIYMLGFTPGFPYLGGMDQKIATPRLENPREKIAAGSVGIAGNQTGIYPIESPGGWQIIGRTPLVLFDKNRQPEILLRAGDYIQFYPMAQDEYEGFGGAS